MTLAPERPCRPAPESGDLLDIAEMVYQNFPGHRAEIVGGRLIVTPPPDGPHGESLTDVMAPLLAADLHRGETRVIQGMGLWLPTDDDDYVVPDLSIVDADFRDHLIKFNCYAPSVFRLVIEVTSSNWRDDTEAKPDAYATAGVPVYVIGDRKHNEVIVLTEPHDGEYFSRSRHLPGETFTLPESIGAKVELEVASLLKG